MVRKTSLREGIHFPPAGSEGGALQTDGARALGVARSGISTNKQALCDGEMNSCVPRSEFNLTLL